MEATTAWGRAIERLRLGKKPEEVGITKDKVIKKGEITYNQIYELGITYQTNYEQWLTGPKGPSIASLDTFLDKLGYTWKEWAEVYEEEKRKPCKLTDKKKPPKKTGTDK